MFRIVKKDNVSNPLLQRLITVVIALVAAGAFIGLCGYSPVTVYTEMVKGSLTSAYCLRQTLIQMVPLLSWLWVLPYASKCSLSISELKDSFIWAL